MNPKIRPMLIVSGGLLVAVILALAQSHAPYQALWNAPALDARSIGPALDDARTADFAQARSLIANLSDPAARKLMLWEFIETSPGALSFAEADGALHDLSGWPHEAQRIAAAERQILGAGLQPTAVIAWFAGRPPATAQGALALANAMKAVGDIDSARNVIRTAWRTLSCGQDTQDAMLAHFGPVLTESDHIVREDMMLYGPQGPATQDLLRLLPKDQQALALARMAVRGGDPRAQSLISALPPALQIAPGLAYERIVSLRDHGHVGAALALVGAVSGKVPQAAAERLWRHGNLAKAALRAGDYRLAYEAAAHSGLTTGEDAAAAEFEAGWLALTKLKDPNEAGEHFERLQTIGLSPLTQSRALFWRARAAELVGDGAAAQRFYVQASRYQTAFYGQLAAARIGRTMIHLGHDPVVSNEDLARFQRRDDIRAARLLFRYGPKDLYEAFVAAISESLPSPTDEAMLVDFTRAQGDPSLSMRVVRNAAKRGFILPDRGYPMYASPSFHNAPDVAFVLGVTRQESSFDPRARSGAGARGMMQLMPATAQAIARKIGAGDGDLDDPDYNMRIGSALLAQTVDELGGSYVMAAAAYNAGPGRIPQWVAACGDPRTSSFDPLEFIECIPFSETRDYVMRVMEATEVYRARLNGGIGPNRLASDLKRGARG